MVIVVYGDDQIRAREKVGELEAAFRTKFDPAGMNLERFPRAGGDKFDPSEAFSAITAAPFLSPKRMVVVKGLFGDAKKDAAEKMWDALKRTPESTITVVWEDTAADSFEKKPAYKELKTWKDTHFYPFKVPEGIALEAWVTERVRAAGGTIQPAAARELVTRVGTDAARIVSEVGKLVAFAAPGMIDRTAVETLVRPSADGDVFALMDSLASSRRGEAVKALEEERTAGSNAFYLLSMLVRQIRLLLSARSLMDERPGVSKPEAAEALGVHPFVAQKLLQHARAYTFAELSDLHAQAFAFDRETKRGGMDADAAVELLTAGLIRSA